MKTIKYSILCEDEAQLLFIKNLLKYHTNPTEIIFRFNDPFFQRFRCSSDKDVYNKYPRSIDQFSFLNPYNLDLVFVGMDYDSRLRGTFKEELEKLYSRLSPNGKEKTVIFFPVQAIEYWLLFLKRKVSNPALTKNIGVDIEKIQRKEAKAILMDNVAETKEELIERLIRVGDIDWLTIQSTSFKMFYEQLKQKLILLK